METIGSLIDKLSINELEIYHMEEQDARDDMDTDFHAECKAWLVILRT